MEEQQLNVYYLMHKNTPVIEFSPYNETARFLNRNLAPFSIRRMPDRFEVIRLFCASRVLQESRKHRDTIIISCNIINATPVSLCLTCYGLSLRDCYWFKEVKGLETWKEVNLYSNPLSQELAEAALTGEETSIPPFGDKVYQLSAELTARGTMAKCYFKKDRQIFLAKALDPDAITAEQLSHAIASALHVPSAQYRKETVFDTPCSVCQIRTNENVELITAGDVLMNYACTMNFESDFYKLFMKVDPLNFVRMQLFDLITLNINRNKDNFALYTENDKLQGMYDLFDHDACFKGLSENAVYFVTGTRFTKSYLMLRENYREVLDHVKPDLQNLHRFLTEEGLLLFQRCDKMKWYNGVLRRTELLLQ